MPPASSASTSPPPAEWLTPALGAPTAGYSSGTPPPPAEWLTPAQGAPTAAGGRARRDAGAVERGRGGARSRDGARGRARSRGGGAAVRRPSPPPPRMPPSWRTAEDDEEPPMPASWQTAEDDEEEIPAAPAPIHLPPLDEAWLILYHNFKFLPTAVVNLIFGFVGDDIVDEDEDDDPNVHFFKK